MKKEEIVKNYFHHLENGNYQGVIQLFSDNAIIFSPLYGEQNPINFYKKLFNDTNRSKITLINIFISANKEDVVAAHFLYDWTMKDGAVAPFECIDVFELNEDNKITKLTIIYDTHQTRIKFAKLKS